MREIRPMPILGTTSTRAKRGHARQPRDGIRVASGDLGASSYADELGVAADADHAIGAYPASVHTAFNTAINAAPTRKAGLIALSAGRFPYSNGLTLSRGGKLHIRGDGQGKTIIKTLTGGLNFFATTPSYPIDELILEGLTIDFATLSGTLLALNGRWCRRLVLDNVEVLNATGTVFSGTGMDEIVIRDLSARCAGTMTGSLAGFTGGNRFDADGIELWWMYSGLGLSGGNPGGSQHDRFATEEFKSISVRNIRAYPLYWWSKPIYSGSGGTVTYADPGTGNDFTLTDSAANFVSVTNSLVKVLHELTTGTISSSGSSASNTDNTQLKDTSKNFTTLGVIRGDEIRTSDRFAIVWSVDGTDTLRLFRWFLISDRSPCESPANGVSYTLYRGLFGGAVLTSSTVITVARWYQFDGAIAGSTYAGGSVAKPANGEAYEVLPAFNSYQFQAAWGVNDGSLRGYECIGGYADNLDMKGSDWNIDDVRLYHGGDVGLTIYGRGHNVSNLQAHTMGATAVYEGCAESHFTDIKIRGAVPWLNHNAWANESATHTAPIMIARAGGYGNEWRGLSSDVATPGFAAHIYGAYTHADSTYHDPVFSGPAILDATEQADIVIGGSLATVPPRVINPRRRDGTPATILHRNIPSVGAGTPPGGRYVGLIGSGTPEGEIVAGPRSTYTDTATGAEWVKATGTGNTGWKQVQYV